MSMVLLRDLLVDALQTLPYLGAQQLIERGTYLIDTANQKNVTLNLDFGKSVANLTKTLKESFRKGKNKGYTAPSQMYRQ